MATSDRKKEHVQLTATGEMAYQKSTGFERYDFVHNALPEVNYEDIDLSAALCGRVFSFPLFISSMTGGYTEAGSVNSIIAEFCEARNLPFGVGSQRAALEDRSLAKTFSVVRDKAPTAFIAANIGGCQLVDTVNEEMVNELIEMIQADAVIVHLNPLQELMQPEGDVRFRGVLDGIRKLVRLTDLPVIVKETGAGLSKKVAAQLIDAGVSVLDTAGAGGTSWAKVENERDRKESPEEIFNEWGIPTVESLQQITSLERSGSIEIIASGGIRNGLEIVKAFCLGADFAATAQPVIASIVSDGIDGLENCFSNFERQAKVALTLLGVSSWDKLTGAHLRQQ